MEPAKKDCFDEEDKGMNIERKKEGSRLTVLLEGELDALSAPALNDLVKNELSDVTELVFDLEKLEYTSSAGLRVFLMAQKIMDEQGSMSVKHANEEVMEIFDETGFTDILELRD